MIYGTARFTQEEAFAAQMETAKMYVYFQSVIASLSNY